ncbi:MAG: sigma factor-like helix-turn-helix DNA-binding protein, partial [Clostridia bacterium]
CIYAHYILGMSNLAIARVEGVNEGNVRKSVSRGLRRLQKKSRGVSRLGGRIRPKNVLNSKKTFSQAAH